MKKLFSFSKKNPEKSNYRERIINMCLKYKPDKLVLVDQMLHRFKGREEELIQSLVKASGPEPTPEEAKLLRAQSKSTHGQKVQTTTRTITIQPTTPVPEKPPRSYRDRLLAIALKHRPDKVPMIDTMLAQFKGREEQLIRSLVQNHGPEPSDEEFEALKAAAAANGNESPPPRSAQSSPRSRVTTPKARPLQTASGQNYRERLINICLKYKPSKVDSVDSMLQHFKGHEEELIQSLVRGYGPEPTAEEIAALTSAQNNPSSTPAITSPTHCETPIPEPTSGSETPVSQPNDPAEGFGDSYKDRLIRIYTKYNPSKIVSISTIVKACVGNEEQMIQTLIRKYGPEPTAEEYQELLNAQANQQQSTEELPQLTVEVNTDSEEPQKKVPVGAVPTVFAVAKNQMAHSTPALTPVVDIQPTNKPTRAQYEQRLRNFYTKYSRSKIPFCSQELDKYQDKEEELFQTLVNIYGPEPTDVELACMVRPTSARIIFLCMKHDPSRLETIARELVAYKGREEALLQSLVESYGEEPSDEEIERLISSGATSKLDIRSRVKYLIMKNCPENVNDVDQIMQAHDGNDVLLLRELIIKYGPEPSMSEIQAFEAPNTPRRVSKMSPILFRQRLHNMFSVYRPDAIGEIASYMTRYAGREEELMHELVEAHGPEPTDEQVRVAREKLAENAAPPKSQVDFRTRLTNFYLKHCPSRLQDIDTILSKCVGTEEQLMEELVAKYGPEPSEKDMSLLQHRTQQIPTLQETGDHRAGLLKVVNPTIPSKPSETQDSASRPNRHALDVPEPVCTSDNTATIGSPVPGATEPTVPLSVVVSDPASDHANKRPPMSVYRARMQAMYQKYDPEMLGSVDIILAQYIGKEDELMQKLLARYGPEPDAASVAVPMNSTSDSLSHRTRLIHIFMRYDPENLPSVDATLAQYIGNEEQMIRDLVAKYGPEPTIAEVAWHTYTNTGSPRASEQHHDTDVRSRMQQFAVKYDPEIIETLNKMFSQYAEQIEKKITSLTHQTEVKTPAPVESAKTQDKKDDYRRRASNFLTKYDPSRLLALPEMMKYFDGQEDEMIRTLLVQYGPEPTDAEIAALQFSNHALEKSDYRARVVRFYTKYDPDKLPNVDAILASFAGREAEMIRSFLVRYGAEPTEEEIHRLKDPSPKQSYRERVLNFLYVYDPKKIDAVDSMLSSFRGEEERLLRTLQVKYGPEPTPEDVITAQSKLVDRSGSIHPGESEISVPVVVTVDVMQEDYQARLINFFSMYNPELIATVPQLLASYKSREEDLLQHLVSQYGPEPTQEEIDFLNENILNNFFGDSAVLNYSARVCNIFQHYDPVNQRLVESVLKNYKGQEDQMMRDLVLRYGPEPLEEYEGGRFVQTYNMYHQRLTRFLAHYDPEKLCEIDAELSCHLGQEEELMMSLTQIYGPESYSDELQPQGLTLPSISALFPKIGANDASLVGYKATARQQSFYV